MHKYLDRSRLATLSDRIPYRAHRFARFARTIWRKYRRNNGPLLTKGLAFSFVWGVVPLLFVVFMLRFVLVTPAVLDIVSEQLLGFLPEGMRSDLVRQLLGLTVGRTGAGIVTVVAFVVAAIALFDSLEQAISTMLGSSRRRLHFRKGLSIVLAMGAVFLFYVIALAAPAGRFFARFFQLPEPLFFWITRLTTGLVFALVLFGLQRLFARRKLRILPSLTIGLLTSLVWQLISYAGGLVFQAVSARYLVYGAIAWAIIFLLFMRILAELIVFSSILIAEFSPSEEEEILRLLQHGAEDRPRDAHTTAVWYSEREHKPSE